MPGLIKHVFSKPGDAILQGEKICIIGMFQKSLGLFKIDYQICLQKQWKCKTVLFLNLMAK